ncbi:outer membrane protein [Fodinibius salsisoli]|uniref:Porin family protein n=1 Tax=Fodinibius salsisoli TaxID=2820877 RepID=A0ABT3PJ35_9BACT|nr:porin family protein [Fodinibius salsisoli]MCW9705914.1 porin family protein [Fodinibius salsisoli]
MKKLIFLPLFALIFTPFINTAQAQSDSDAIKNTIGIGPRLGYYKADDAEEGSFYGGAQIRARLGRVIGIEGAVDYRTSQEYDLGEFSADVRQIPVTASALLFLPIDEHFQPYGVAGLGAYYNMIDYNSDAEGLPGIEDDHTVDFGYHLGAGLELPINDKVAINADYRYIFLDPGSDSFGDVEDADLSGNVFTAGLMFYM